MTRSTVSEFSPQVTKKSFRERATEANLAFRTAAEKRTKVLASHKIYPRSRTTAREPYSRADGTYWNDAGYICARKTWGVMLGDYVDEDSMTSCYDDCPVCEEARRAESESVWFGEGSCRSPRRAVLDSLLDIAKPAKLKGVEKEFEFVPRPRQVIALSDVDISCWEKEVPVPVWNDDDWESDGDSDFYLEAGGRRPIFQERLAYSTVVRRDWEEGTKSNEGGG